MNITSNKKIVSCGFIIHTDDGLLACHVTGKNDSDGNYDIPKGCQESNESPWNTACRELYEETGLNIYHLTREVKQLGYYQYHPNKDLYLIYARVKERIDLSKLTCTSTFTYNGKEFPEVDSYKFVKNIKCFFPKLQAILLECNKQIKFLNEL